jgi:homoserine dehydrogenase
VGDTLYYGAGAGRMPTASAVVADLVDTALGRAAITFAARDLFGESASRRVRPVEETVTRYYLRFDVADRPGVLGGVAGILGNHAISIASVLQHEPTDTEHVALIIMTHEALERDMRAALDEMGRLDVVHGRPVCIRVIGQERSP